jgi:hypothetical protein
LQPSDLGEASLSSDGRFVFISFITAPLATGRENRYVVMVTDAGLATAVQSFEWTITENSSPPAVSSTEEGQITYTPTAEGKVEIKLRLLDAGASEQGSITVTQEIGSLNAELETLIADAATKPGAGMGNPDVLREIVNDHNPYYLDPVLKVPEPGKGFALLLFNTLVDGVLQSDVQKRDYQLEQVAAALNDAAPDFATAILPGLGVTKMRLVVMTMLLFPGKLPFTELPDASADNLLADEQLRQQLAALSDDDKLDLFNTLRFPKSNIITCSKLLEALRDKFFNGVAFDDVLTKMTGTMADWLMLNYSKGPLHRN